MKKYILSILALAALVAAGCAKQEAAPAPSKGRVVTITATLDNTVTKVTTGSEIGKFAWEADDVIGVWDGEKFVPFTLEPSAAGAVAGKFSGTLDEGKELSFAVYPYSEADEYNSEDGTYTSNWNETWWGDYKPTVHLYAPKAGDANSYKFQHLCAYLMVTIKNVRADCKYAYLETVNGEFFLTGGQTATITSETEFPKFTAGAQAQGFVPLPEDHSKIVFYAPVIPGEWDNKYITIKFFQDLDWDKEYGKGALSGEENINKVGYIQTGGVINRGDLIVLPAIDFGGGEGGGSGLSATIEGGLSWLSGSTIGLWNGTGLTPMTVASGNVAEGEFEGDLPEGASYAIAPTTGVTLEGTVLTIEKDTWNYALGPAIFGPVGAPTSSSFAASVAFKHLGAVVRATLNNVPEAVKWVFLETGPDSKFFYNEASADLSTETPTLAGDAVNDWCFAALPEHGDAARIVLDVPILPGEYKDTAPMFNIELYTEPDWGKKIDGSKLNMRMTDTAGKLPRGTVVELSYTW